MCACIFVAYRHPSQSLSLFGWPQLCSYHNTKKIDEVKTINALGIWTFTKKFLSSLVWNATILRAKNIHSCNKRTDFVQVTCRYRLGLSLSAVANADFKIHSFIQIFLFSICNEFFLFEYVFWNYHPFSQASRSLLPSANVRRYTTICLWLKENTLLCIKNE